MKEENEIKKEPIEDYTYEYEGAPSPEAPVHSLIPLQSIPAEKLTAPKDQYRKRTLKKINNTENNNYLFNMGELEKQYTVFKKMMPDCQNYGTPPNVLDTRIGKHSEDKATQCAEGYINSTFKSVKDASTETCTMIEEFYYKSYFGVCKCNKLIEQPREVTAAAERNEDVEIRGAEADRLPMQDTPMNN